MDTGVIPLWQPLCLSGLLGFVVAASLFGLTRRLRSIVQPWVVLRVQSELPLILQIQRWQHRYLDNFFSLLSCIVSVPFYTGFIPILFWSGHSKLGRQVTFLMAFCDYIGNALKDAVSAPRPSSPPVRRVTATEDEKENAMEYGLPSSHALNTVCLSGYLLHYALTTYGNEMNGFRVWIGFFLVVLLVSLIAIGRIYLGMHSFIDVAAGIAMGVIILAFWLVVDDHIDNFVTSGPNVTSFCAGLSLVLLFAYPTPEAPTPSFEYHTAFNGVAFGLVSGVQQTYHLFHSEDIPRIFSSELSIPVFFGRLLAGIPTILIVKFCSKALAKWLFPVICNTLGIPIRSSCYIAALKESESSKNKSDNKQLGFLQRAISLLPHKTYDVDTGIRFIQYAGLGWSVSDLVPYIFTRLYLS
ncbi:lipid phosphate phosphatase delta [Phalaenopsis equestris]|uniref:lipid phosphate phosphatase delta n=1 Tax=Phalaenopsis equestris TaxID=78828 RepID=UPI0009E6596C|nr:lipid phosphate phosphatase delta [Phalaenopsis equestris]